MSGIRFFLAMLTSSFRNFSYCSLMYFSMGSQLGVEGWVGRKQMDVPERKACWPLSLRPPWIAFLVKQSQNSHGDLVL